VLGAGTFFTGHVAGLAGAATPGVAAVAVNTLAARALGVNGAGLSIVLAGYAGGTQAVRVTAAIAVLGARIAASEANAIALVGAT